MLPRDWERFADHEGHGVISRALGSTHRSILGTWSADDLDRVIYSSEETNCDPESGSKRGKVNPDVYPLTNLHLPVKITVLSKGAML